MKKEIKMWGQVLSLITISEAKNPETTEENKTAIPLSNKVPEEDVQ